MDHFAIKWENKLIRLELQELSQPEVEFVAGGESLPPICNNVSGRLSLIINVAAVANSVASTFKSGVTPPEAQPNWDSIGASQQTANAGSGSVVCSPTGGFGEGDSVYKKTLP